MLKITTEAELINELNKIDGLRRATIETQTSVKMNKKGVEDKTLVNEFGKVFKCQKITVELNSNYEQLVNIQRLVEGVEEDFKAEGLRWGKAINNVVVEKDGQFYVKTIELERDENKVYIKEDGTVVDYADLKPFIPKYNGSNKQQLEEQVNVRTFKISSILSMKIEGLFEFERQ